MTPVRLKPAALWSRVKHSTTEPLRSHDLYKAMTIPKCSLADPGGGLYEPPLGQNYFICLGNYQKNLGGNNK